MWTIHFKLYVYTENKCTVYYLVNFKEVNSIIIIGIPLSIQRISVIVTTLEVISIRG